MAIRTPREFNYIVIIFQRDYNLLLIFNTKGHPLQKILNAIKKDNKRSFEYKKAVITINYYTPENHLKQEYST